MSKINLIILFLTLSSCSSMGAKNRVVLRLYNDEIKLKTTIQEVVKKYGKQNQEWIDSNGDLVLSYSASKVVYGAMSFFPIPLTKSRFNNYEIVLTFDKKGYLADVKKFIDCQETLPVTVCESDLADCNLGYKVVERR